MTYAGLLQKFAGTAKGIPWFVRNKHVGTFLEAVAMTLDEGLETLNQGLRLSQPLNCDSSALPVLSRDRGISIYETEPEASKRYRLSRWHQLRRQFGTHQGELRNLAPYFLPATPLMRIVHQDGNGDRATWHTLAADGSYSIHKAEPSNWDFDGVPARWSRWWAIIYLTDEMRFAAPAEYGDGCAWGDGTVWGLGPTAADNADIIAALKEAQGAHSMLWGVILTRELDAFDPTATAVVDAEGWSSLPTGNWGFCIDNGTGLPSRPPYASFIYDKGQATEP